MGTETQGWSPLLLAPNDNSGERGGSVRRRSWTFWVLMRCSCWLAVIVTCPRTLSWRVVECAYACWDPPHSDLGPGPDPDPKARGSPPALLRLNPRSDWADDERDTGHVTADWGRDDGLTRSEHYWDRDYGISRTSVLPQKNMGVFTWQKGYKHEQDGKQYRNHMVKSTIQRSEQKDQFGDGLSVRSRGDVSQHITLSKSSTSSGSEGLTVNDPILNGVNILLVFGQK
ncbi:hypothetical protein AgCh_036015 [Apium graveolens]